MIGTERLRDYMIQIDHKNDCNGCTACSEICPQNCIQMKADDTGFLYPQVDREKCVQCGLCEQVCPVKNRVPLEKVCQKKAYAAYAKDTQRRKKSASGGVFPLFVEAILDKEGIVYGVCYEERADQIVVCHKMARSKTEAEEFYNAKYVQSHIIDVYSHIGEQLMGERKVLFSGTPCQVAGLKNYLRKKNCSMENLYCVDNICHGVPSPKAWQCYVEYCRYVDGNRGHGKLPHINLRDKSTGWSNYAASISRTYEDGSLIREKAADNVYMRAFMTSLSLRPSCSNCAFKGYERESDITLGDFWGIWRLHKECDDDQGTSAVLIHSEKGMTLWNEIQEKGVLGKCLEVSGEEIAQMNRNLLVPAEENPNRDDFLRLVNGENFAQLVNQYEPKREETFAEKCRNIVSRGFRKIIK